MRVLSILLLAASLAAAKHTSAQPPAEAIAVTIGADGQVLVERIDTPIHTDVLGRNGLLIWPDNGRDRWKVLPTQDQPGRSQYATPSTSPSDNLTRGLQSLTLGGQPAFTARLDQLVGGEMLRAAEEGGLLLPADGGSHLRSQVVFVRARSAGTTPFPTDTFTLRHRGGLTAELTLPEGAERVAWASVERVPDAWQDGLPPGDYLLRPPSGGSVRFSVADESRRREVLRHATAIGELVESKDDPLLLQVEVESMLGGHPAYPADALARLEEIADESLTRRLRKLRDELRARLVGGRPPAGTSEDDTGLASIDLARRQISLGQWTAAAETLASIGPDASPRERAFAELYAAVLAAESGPTTADEADARFLAAARLLANGAPADQFRVAMNHAEFLLNLARDAVYNASIRAASNSPTPLYTGLTYWLEAHRTISDARRVAGVDGSQGAALLVVESRLDTLLADYAAAMRGDKVELRAADALINSTREASAKRLTEVVANGSGADPQTRAAAYELLALLAHRHRATDDSRAYAEEAIRLRLEAGELAGVEAGQRSIAMALLRQASDHVAGADALRGEAVRRLKLAQALSEFLRARFPADQIGLSRAGFLAKRAYVSDKLVELLVAAGSPHEALRYAELSKARAFEDYLSTQGVAVHAAATPSEYLKQQLAEWPPGVVALEYFVGADRAHVFLVTDAGVEARTLLDEQGRPLDPTRLVAETRELLGGMDHAARKLSVAIAAGKAGDARWQDRLSWLYQRLVPQPFADRAHGAETLLVVPHHVLHYLPFAALVIKPDQAEHAYYQVPRPEYLIDHVNAIATAPSLVTYGRLRERATGFHHFNGFGRSTFVGAPPLPGVETDLKTLSRVFADGLGEIRKGEQTTESDLVTLLGDPGALLVGTHGQNIPSAPLFSYLRCGRDAPDDGLLQAGELYSGRTNAPLVILSACYSGLADQAPMQGDDLFGLRRALLQSGAAAVVSGAWDVFDRTGAAMMERFLSELHAGRPVAAALAEAQRGFLRTERDGGGIYSHPYFWSVLSLTGNDHLMFRPEG